MRREGKGGKSAVGLSGRKEGESKIREIGARDGLREAVKRIVAMSAKKEKEEQSAVVRSDEGVAKRKTWREKEENV